MTLRSCLTEFCQRKRGIGKALHLRQHQFVFLKVYLRGVSAKAPTVSVISHQHMSFDVCPANLEVFLAVSCSHTAATTVLCLPNQLPRVSCLAPDPHLLPLRLCLCLIASVVHWPLPLPHTNNVPTICIFCRQQYILERYRSSHSSQHTTLQ